MSMFDEIVNAKASFKSNNLQEGSGLLVVDKLLYKSLDAGRTFIAEMKVLEARPSGQLDSTGRPAVANAPGQRVGYVQQLQRFKSAPGNTKAFFMALLGLEDTDLDTPEKLTALDKNIQELLSDSQPARGVLIAFDTYRQPTKAQKAAGKGEYNVYPRFFHVPDQKPEDIAARRVQLEGEAADEE